MDYGHLLPVYSIWIVMNCEENSLSHIHLQEDILCGKKSWDGSYDAIHLYMIGLSDEVPERKEGMELHRFLGTIFSETMTKEKKIEILETEYEIPMNRELKEEVSQMCNLSEYFIQRGIEKGIEKGIEQGIVVKKKQLIENMLRDDQPFELISKYAKCSIEEVRQVEETMLSTYVK